MRGRSPGYLNAPPRPPSTTSLHHSRVLLSAFLAIHLEFLNVFGSSFADECCFVDSGHALLNPSLSPSQHHSPFCLEPAPRPSTHALQVRAAYLDPWSPVLGEGDQPAQTCRSLALSCIVICGATGYGGCLTVTDGQHRGPERELPQLLAVTVVTSHPPLPGVESGRREERHYGLVGMVSGKVG